MLSPPMSWRICCSLSVKVCIYLRSLCVPSIYDAAIMYASLSLTRYFLFPSFSVTTFLFITSPTILFVIFPTPMISHGCSREEVLSGGEIAFKKKVRMKFGTLSFTRISENLDLSNIIISYAWKRSHYVYVWYWTDGRLRLVLTHIYICCWL